jgi:hypothetical protein
VVVPAAGAQGVIVALGGIIGGWSLYARDGKLKYCYNFYGVDRYTIEAASTIPPGTHQVRMEFKYDGGGLARGGLVTLYVDGNKVGEGRVERTEPMIFSADETCDVGNEFGSPVTYDYPTPRKFNGEVNWVEIDIGEAAVNLDHLIAPEQRLRVAMGMQQHQVPEWPTLRRHPHRHAGAGRYPRLPLWQQRKPWIPACAGMTGMQRRRVNPSPVGRARRAARRRAIHCRRPDTWPGKTSPRETLTAAG